MGVDSVFMALAESDKFYHQMMGCLGLLHANFPVRVTLKFISFFLPRTPIKSISFSSLEHGCPFQVPPHDQIYICWSPSRSCAQQLRDHSAIHNDGPTHPLHTPILRLLLKSPIFLPTPIPRHLSRISRPLPTATGSPTSNTAPLGNKLECSLSGIRAHESRLP